jgi:NAD(P)-dependent dehydrogenase (short-subunit alcohol dehydrogenase family)
MTDTIVWITGASAGIGLALAETVPYDGARVIDISRSGGASGAEHVPADLTDPSSWAAVEAHLLSQLGVFEGDRAIFVHCAGVLEPIGFAGEVDSQGYRSQVLLNSGAPQALGHAFLAALETAGCTGELVLLTSGAASTPYEGMSAYCAGKAAVEQWVRVVGREQQRRGDRCRVLAISPGPVETGMQELIRSTREEDFPALGRFVELHETGANLDPKEAAQGIWRLLAGDARSGSVLDLRR